MKRLQNNMKAGDKVIDIVGFSRGAALAVDFANKIAKDVKGATVRFLGVWDIVADFGLPGMDIGHNVDYPPNVEHCCHAMALDEHRQSFPVTRLSKEGKNQPGLEEVWFRGVHSDVGGGNGNLSLNKIALNWMFQNARQFGLPITDEAIALNLKRSNGPPTVDKKFEIGTLRDVRRTDFLHSSVDLSDKGDPLFPLNNPTFLLARVSDPGAIAGTVSA